MKVKLISMTPKPIDVMWTAARTCYSSQSPIGMWEDRYDLEPGWAISEKEYNKYQEKMWKLVQQVLNSGHQSIAESVYFTFAVEGVTRACMAQITRHRAGIVFSVQSQRYVNLKDGFNYETPQSIKSDVELQGDFEELMGSIYSFYKKAIEKNIKLEDARAVLPNACTTNITFSVNYRELMHLCNLRLCQRAQTEIRNLFKEIVKEVKAQDVRLAQYLVPQCEVNGFCKEHSCCGRKPTLKKIKETSAVK